VGVLVEEKYPSTQIPKYPRKQPKSQRTAEVDASKSGDPASLRQAGDRERKTVWEYGSPAQSSALWRVNRPMREGINVNTCQS
jgi:hypothetical protein